MNSRLIAAMGRITGVSPAGARERLLRAAAAAFQSQGYEGTRVADIATGAGVSNGALYSHFDSKTELWPRRCGPTARSSWPRSSSTIPSGR